jgi:hypothetical protein
MAQDLRTSRELMLRHAGSRAVNETDAVHLTQEKHPDLPQVSQEDPDSASSQGVRLQTIEATGPTEAWDGQETYEQGMARKNAGLFSRLRKNSVYS